jgi:hypothetical protein
VKCYFDLWANVASAEKEVEASSLALAAMLDELQIQKKEVVIVPESFQVPPGQVAVVECERMIVRQDAIAFMAIPKHAGF